MCHVRHISTQATPATGQGCIEKAVLRSLCLTRGAGSVCVRLRCRFEEQLQSPINYFDEFSERKAIHGVGTLIDRRISTLAAEIESFYTGGQTPETMLDI